MSDLRAPEAPAFLREMLGADPSRMTAFVAAFWPHLTGGELAARTRVIKVEDGVLIVQVPDARWRKELYKMQVPLLIRLRELLGAAAPRRLGFMEARGGLVTPNAPRRPPAAPVMAQAPRPAILEAAAAIEDEALRAAFIGAATRYLSTFDGGKA